jgi:hypothetical protein
MYTWIRVFILFFCVLSTAGCGKLKQAEELGRLSEELSDSFSAMSDDIYFSCLRKSRYNSGRFPDIITVREANDSKCEEKYRPVSDKVKDVNFILIGYMGAIGTLATNRPGFFRPNIDRLQDSLNSVNDQLPAVGITTINPNAITSGFNVLNVLADIFTYKFRYSNTKTAVVCTDQDIQNYIPHLKNIFQQGYIPLLDSERQLVNAYFRDLTPPPTATNNLTDRESSYNLTENYNNVIDQIILRKRAAAAYVQILETTAETHAAIANEFLGETPKNSEKIINKCQKFFKEGRQLQGGKVSSSSTLPINSSLSNKQVQRLETILSQYYVSVSNLNQTISEAYRK